MLVLIVIYYLNAKRWIMVIYKKNCHKGFILLGTSCMTYVLTRITLTSNKSSHLQKWQLFVCLKNLCFWKHFSANALKSNIFFYFKNLSHFWGILASIIFIFEIHVGFFQIICCLLVYLVLGRCLQEPKLFNFNECGSDFCCVTTALCGNTACFEH